MLRVVGALAASLLLFGPAKASTWRAGDEASFHQFCATKEVQLERAEAAVRGDYGEANRILAEATTDETCYSLLFPYYATARLIQFHGEFVDADGDIFELWEVRADNNEKPAAFVLLKSSRGKHEDVPLDSDGKSVKDSI